MKKSFLSRLACLLVVGLALTLPLTAQAKKAATDTPAATTPSPVPPAAVPAADTTTPAPITMAPTPPKPAETATEKVTAGDLILSHASVDIKGDTIDLFITIKNSGKIDERIVGIGSLWNVGETFQVTKGKDGKEAESPIVIDIPAGKTVELAADATWLRFHDAKDKPKDATVMPVSLYFRHSPNANLKAAIGAKSGGSFLDWFKK